jgi:pyruvate dehydrogenase E1 component beta subunit/2-oxoisovalerate dehydrogenase E1 component beta subunit
VSITYLEAIREAQARALADDPRVFIYGQDIGPFGGAFKATKRLDAEFPGRVIDSPISEDAMMGLAVGAAIEGLRPIIEMQFADFSTVGFNQIVNQAATLHWRTRVPCPIVVRLPSGGTETISRRCPSRARQRAFSRGARCSQVSLVVFGGSGSPITIEDVAARTLE